MGKNYKTAPTIGFSSAPVGGVTAVGIASLTNSYIGCDGTNTGKIMSIDLTNAGCGYTVAPIVTIQGGGGTGAAASAGITTLTSVMSITVTNAGSGYTSNPSITFEDPGAGIGYTVATGYGVINSAGIVTYAVITNSGAGYTTAPDLTFESPSGIGTDSSGSFIFNEIVTSQSSGTTARVKEYDAVNNTLEISIVDGSFGPGEILVGSESGARHVIRTVNTDDLVTPYADNDTIEIEADSIINFSKSNPFGMP